MLSGIMKLFARPDGSASKSLAKSRLHVVLVQDRAGLSNDELAQFKREMIEVIEKYFVIDESGVDISYQRENESTTLLINSPIIVKREFEAWEKKARLEEEEKSEEVPAPLEEPTPEEESKIESAG